MNSWNDRISAEVRADAGYAAWSSDADFAAGRPIPPRMPGFGERGMPLILMHHYGGSPQHPAWYRNLMANPRVTVEVGTQTVQAVARLTEGAERERIWAKEIALVPKFAEFEAAAGRQIPVVVLERIRE
ncbi:nitroreductase family deazaflavin-dependent oxidoreductase [Nocardia terpenica]|nr:nitroreductase family deazaflavin-dependent oxidoreductase [Nocardia terpenica]MBF6105984.1 nitroreductase family deazaflavin-dependent oxidoreductase [Nocardia terpenica]MBF6113431.1 nitroreductase family deazaflavin-dependent oxidoreductase [Nocardia terpenica]MBF6119725.1 nitroreductase family deazaflavin-dependent oxidoreductase [Nocardia terpenica]MBF6152136.1 nitroreductase family deazaflavin-dependent oxidoreductase [Nocardia terpenica]